MDKAEGVVIQQVRRDSAAAKAGLSAHDGSLRLMVLKHQKSCWRNMQTARERFTFVYFPPR